MEETKPGKVVPETTSGWTRFRFAVVLLCVPGSFFLPYFMYDTHRHFDEPGTIAYADAVVGMIVAVLVLEAGLWFASELWQEALQRWPAGRPIPPNLASHWWWAIVVQSHLMGLGTFFTTLDGGLTWAAARWVYLGYAVPAIALAITRWGRWTLPERLFLRWGWAPVFALGVPVALPRLLAAGLITSR